MRPVKIGGNPAGFVQQPSRTAIYFKKQKQPFSIRKRLRLSRKPHEVNHAYQRRWGIFPEEFTSAFEIRENTFKSNPIHEFQQRLEEDTPPEYHTNSGFDKLSLFLYEKGCSH
ncbi:hypothetical protein ACHHV8_05390 [Paenibacillus sp. TAB 01]|uniref:hypothetical protein n=1 Tax=Paenibacillus sp. TAB 01 TaxID=3368988 RepID=UPI003751623C